MKKYVIMLVFILITVTIVSAKEYESSYGFSINVPEHWLVLTRTELKENPDLFEFENMDSGNIDKNLLKQVIDKIQSGNTEMFLNQKTADAVFTDNINVMKFAGRLPETDQNLGKLSDDLKAQLTKYFGRPVNMYQCEFATIDNKRALLTEFDGAGGGTTSVQYQFQKSPSILVVITATSKNETIDIIREEFHKMINSVRFK